MSFEEMFDYIVVGAGSAGCVVANRLSGAAGQRVLLLEAGGPDTRPEIHEPRDLLKLWGSEVDWGYNTVPQPNLNGRQIFISRGKVLGGSSAINAMIYIRGNRRDFDHWNFLGNEGWSYEEVLPYFKRSEDYAGPPSPYHGVGGPLSVVDHPSPTPVAQAFAAAGPELGYKGPEFDFNGEQHEEGTGLYQFNITRDGRRASEAVAFLAPIQGRTNLTVRTGAQVTRIVLDGTRATGVEYVRDGQTHRARAEREVVLCAGSFDSPRLLMLSGIGPADHLRSHGIAVTVDLPGVGENLQDHLLLPVMYRSKRELPLPTFIAEAGLFVHTRGGMKAASPDLQYHFSAGIPAFIPKDYPVEGPTYFFVPILAQPQSRGTVRLRSANPIDPAVIDPRYLSCEVDLRVLLHGIRLAREIANTRAFTEFGSDEAAPGRNKTEQELREYIRGHCSTVWHVAGTCRMGYDTMAVVDPRLCVHGITGLRVADASVMPTITSGNTNAACVMIGEKVSDMILAGTRA